MGSAVVHLHLSERAVNGGQRIGTVYAQIPALVRAFESILLRLHRGVVKEEEPHGGC